MTNNELKKAGLTWLKLRSLKYSSAGKNRIFDLKGRKVHFKNADELLFGLREIYIEELYKIQFDTSTPYIIDCGANIGLSILYLKEHFPLAKITAFEPDDSNYELLTQNTQDLKDVLTIKKAVWKENASISFTGVGTLSSRITTEEGGNVVMIPSVRLKDYLTQRIDLLKLDIEGAEYEVLKDCAGQLSEVRNLFIEYHGQFENLDQLNEIFQIVRQDGFSYYIKEAAETYPTPFFRQGEKPDYDVQLNIFCFKN